MLRNITFILFIFSVLSATAQDIKSMTVEELNKAKAEAIYSENFELAQQIKDEISNRKSLEEIKAELISQKKEALENENYQKASEIKVKLDKIEQIFSINYEIEIAVQSENYTKASELKDFREELLNEVNGISNKKDVTVNASNTSEKDTTLFKSNSGTYLRPTKNNNYKKSGDIKFLQQIGGSLGLGVIFNNIIFSHNGVKQKYDMGTGFRFDGISTHYLTEFNKNSGLSGYAQFGYMLKKYDFEQNNIHYKLNYLTSGMGLKIYLNGVYAKLGYFLDTGLWGKQWYDSGIEYNVFEEKVFQIFDFGITSTIGYEFSVIEFYLENRFGIANIEGTEDTNNNNEGTYSRGLSLGLNIKLNNKNSNK